MSARILIASLVSAGVLLGGSASASPFSDDAIPNSWGASDGAVEVIDGASLAGTEGIAPRSAIATSGPGSCRLIVWEPGWDKSSSWLGLQGGRENCANHVNFTLSLRKERPWRPDQILNSLNMAGNRIDRVYARCAGNGTYYGRVASGTGNMITGEKQYLCY